MHEAACGGLILRIGMIRHRTVTTVHSGQKHQSWQEQQARLVHANSLNIRYKVPLVPAQRACLQSILIQHGGEQGKRDG